MRYVSSAIDDKLYEDLVETAKLEERTISNFIRVSIKERIIKIRQLNEELGGEE